MTDAPGGETAEDFKKGQPELGATVRDFRTVRKAHLETIKRTQAQIEKKDK